MCYYPRLAMQGTMALRRIVAVGLLVGVMAPSVRRPGDFAPRCHTCSEHICHAGTLVIRAAPPHRATRQEPPAPDCQRALGAA